MEEQPGADELAGMMDIADEDEEEEEEEEEEQEEEEEEEEMGPQEMEMDVENPTTPPPPVSQEEEESYNWKENVLDVLALRTGRDIPYVCVSANHPEERGYCIYPNGRASPVMGVLVECLYKMRDLKHGEPMLILNLLNTLKFPEYHVPLQQTTSDAIVDQIREIQYFADLMSPRENDFLLCFQEPSGRIWCRIGPDYNQLNALIYFLMEYFAHTKVFDVGSIESVIEAGEDASRLLHVETKTVDVFRNLVKGIKL